MLMINCRLSFWILFLIGCGTASAAPSQMGAAAITLKLSEFQALARQSPEQPSAPPFLRGAATPGLPNFTAISYADTGRFPPDTAGAVGPTQLVVAVNGRIRSFNKNTGLADGILDVETGTFFSAVVTPPLNNNTVQNPQLRFDRLSGRWFIVMTDLPAGGTQNNRVLLAVSSASVLSATSSFSFFQYSLVSGRVAGEVSLGIDANALYIGANLYDLTGFFVSSAASVVRKSSLLSGGPIVHTTFASIATIAQPGPYTPQGVDGVEAVAAAGWFIGVDITQFGRLQLRRVSNAGGTPQLSANLTIDVPATSFPIKVPHLGNLNGSNGELRSGDDRLAAAIVRNGQLWTAHHIGVAANGLASATASRNATRWYTLDVSGAQPTLLQSGSIFDAADSAPLSYWMPSVMVSGQHHAAFGFSVAGANSVIDGATVGRLAADPAGSTQGPPLRFTSGVAGYNPPLDPGNGKGRQWGARSQTSLDPCDDMTFWTVQQFADAAQSWAVRAVRLAAPLPALSACTAPVQLQRGASNVQLTLRGEGLFDTAATASACRIRAEVNVGGTGVIVEAFDWLTATTALVLVSASADAPLGARELTWRNPDGQSASATNCLNVISDVIFSSGFE